MENKEKEKYRSATNVTLVPGENVNYRSAYSRALAIYIYTAWYTINIHLCSYSAACMLRRAAPHRVAPPQTVVQRNATQRSTAQLNTDNAINLFVRRGRARFIISAVLDCRARGNMRTYFAHCLLV